MNKGGRHSSRGQFSALEGASVRALQPFCRPCLNIFSKRVTTSPARPPACSALLHRPAFAPPPVGAPQNRQRDQEPLLLHHAQAAEAGREKRGPRGHPHRQHREVGTGLGSRACDRHGAARSFFLFCGWALLASLDDEILRVARPLLLCRRPPRTFSRARGFRRAAAAACPSVCLCSLLAVVSVRHAVISRSPSAWSDAVQ